jgi:hypothetical protein
LATVSADFIELVKVPPLAAAIALEHLSLAALLEVIALRCRPEVLDIETVKSLLVIGEIEDGDGREMVEVPVGAVVFPVHLRGESRLDNDPESIPDTPVKNSTLGRPPGR